MHKSESGATSSYESEPLHYIRPTLLRRIARRFALGETRHKRGSWKRSYGKTIDVKWLRERYDHAYNHLLALRDGTSTDDHIGALGWFLNFADEVEEMGLDWHDILAIVTPEQENYMNHKIQHSYQNGNGYADRIVLNDEAIQFEDMQMRHIEVEE